LVFDAYSWLVIAPALGLIAAVLLHLLLARLTGGERAYGCVLRGFVGGGLGTLGISLGALANMAEVSTVDWIALLLFNLVIYAAWLRLTSISSA